MHLLLIEDNAALQTTLQRSLVRVRIRVDVCGHGSQAVAAWQQCQPDVVVLDLNLPGQDGLDVLLQARRAGLQTPVLILTARSTVGDRVLGLNAGADDYLPKPFELDELEARIRALHRRNTGLAQPSDRMTVGNLHIDRHSGAAYRGTQVLDLTPRELALLQALMAQPGRALSKERLFEMVFPNQGEVQFEAIEVVVYRLRKKLADTGVNLVTLRGLGYLIRVED